MDIFFDLFDGRCILEIHARNPDHLTSHLFKIEDLLDHFFSVFCRNVAHRLNDHLVVSTKDQITHANTSRFISFHIYTSFSYSIYHFSKQDEGKRSR